jgi:heptosyltransferase I
MSVPESICLLRLSALGDVTHVLPIVHTLRRHWPQTRLTWVIGKLEARLVGDLPDVEFIVFDKGAGWRGYRDLHRQLAGRRFDLAFIMQVALRANLASLAIRAPVRIGFDRARAKDGHGLFVNRRIAPGPGAHVIEGFFGFLQAAGLAAREWCWDLPIPAEAQAWAAAQCPPDRRVLLLSPCSSHPRRNWRAERYARVADHAARRHGLRVVLCGGPSAAERAMGDAILAATTGEPPVDLIGKDTLKRFLALLERACVLISPDSGPAHMATCTGTPVIGLYAASNPARSGPYNSRPWCVDRYDAAARHFLGRPASELAWGRKLEFPGVMDLIEPKAVIERLDALMAWRAAQGEP